MAAAAPIAIGLQAVGGVIGAYGQLQEGQAAKAAADYRAQVANNNAILAERAARDAELRGEIEVSQQRSRTRQLIGSQRAAAAAQGVEVDTGTIAQITESTAGMGELDALTLRSNAAREALGFRIEKSNLKSQQELEKAAGKQARTASRFAAASTLLGSGSAVADKWYNYSQLTPGSTGSWAAPRNRGY